MLSSASRQGSEGWQRRGGAVYFLYLSPRPVRLGTALTQKACSIAAFSKGSSERFRPGFWVASCSLVSWKERQRSHPTKGSSVSLPPFPYVPLVLKLLWVPLRASSGSVAQRHGSEQMCSIPTAMRMQSSPQAREGMLCPNPPSPQLPREALPVVPCGCQKVI